MASYTFIDFKVYEKTKKLTNSADTVSIKKYGVSDSNLYCLSGNDKVTIYKSGMSDSKLYLDKGNDTVYVYDGSFASSQIYLGAGNDYFETKKSTGTSRYLDYTVYGNSGTNTYKLTIGDDLTIKGGTGVDKFTVSGNISEFKLYGGKGNDYFKVVKGNVSVGGYNSDTLTISGDSGNDKIYVGTDSRYKVTGSVSIDGGSGNDIITVGQYFKGSIYDGIKGGTGKDTIKITKQKNTSVWGDKYFDSDTARSKNDVTSNNDVITVTSCESVNIHGGGGLDKITVTDSVDCDVYGGYGYSSHKYADVITVKGSSYNNKIYAEKNDKVYLTSGHDNKVEVTNGGGAAIWVDLTKSKNNLIDSYSYSSKINLYTDSSYKNFTLTQDGYTYVISNGSQTVKIEASSYASSSAAPVISFQNKSQAANNTATTFSGNIFSLINYNNSVISFKNIQVASTGTVKSSAFNYSATKQFITGTK